MAASRELCISQFLIGLGVVLCLATPTQAAEGDIQLLGSIRGFEGRLMIEHNGVLRTVCFDDWTFQDASTACRQLGYPKGAMITRGNDGEFAGPAVTPTIQAPGCTTAINDRLSDCPNFEYRENLVCSSEVDISCYVNDFEGCYLAPPGSWITNQLLPHPTDASTIERCLQFCRQSNARFAALAELRCQCGADVGSLGTAQPTEKCATPCTVDPTAACGKDINAVQGYFAVWPATVGESSADVSTADGCFYSPNFPGLYPTTGSATNHEYRVTLPTTAYVSFTVKMRDLNALDSIHVQDRTAGSGMTLVDGAMFAFGTSVVPFSFRLSKFALIFSVDEQSPNERDYGFLVCYRSLATLPLDPTTPPPSAPPTNPSIAPPTAPPPNPTTYPPMPTNPQPSTQPMAPPGTTAWPGTTVALGQAQATTSWSGIVHATTETVVRRTTIDTVPSTDRPQAKRRCYVPFVSNSAFTDAIVPYVYEGDTYTLECAPGYKPEGGYAFFCQANGSFNRELRCEGDSSAPGLNFTILIMCFVILILLCLTIFVVVCALVCCRKKSDKAGKPPSKKPAAKKLSPRKPAPKLPPVVVPATAILISDDAVISRQYADQQPILSDTDDHFNGNDYHLDMGADDADGFESNRPTVPPPAPPETEPLAVVGPFAVPEPTTPEIATPEIETPNVDIADDEGAPVIDNPIHVDSPQ